MKALRTVRLDSSNTFVFDNPAQSGEWAVSGACAFASIGPSDLKGKARAAFPSGFLGIHSPGWSTLVQIGEATEAERARVVDVLAHPLREHFGAPNGAMARAAAEQEIDFAVSLADHPTGTLGAVARAIEGGSIRERFRSLFPAANRPTSAYAFLQASGEQKASAQEVDPISLTSRVAR